MATFKPGQTVETRDPVVEVTVTSEDPLPIGRIRFQLVVVDDSGNVSAPAVMTIAVMDTEAPTAVIDGPSRVSFGQGFQLSGRQSVDLGGGRIVSYQWTRLD